MSVVSAVETKPVHAGGSPLPPWVIIIDEVELTIFAVTLNRDPMKNPRYGCGEF